MDRTSNMLGYIWKENWIEPEQVLLVDIGRKSQLLMEKKLRISKILKPIWTSWYSVKGYSEQFEY